MWRWDQGRLLYFQFDVLRDIAKTLVKFDNADISKCENLFRQTLVTETGKPYFPDITLPNSVCTPFALF